MSSLVVYKVFIALALFLVALVGGLAPVVLHSLNVSGRSVAACNALAGGVLLAAALVHLLPDATENLQGLGLDLRRLQDPDTDDIFPVAPVVVAFAFLMLAVFESYMDVEGHNHGFPEAPVELDEVPEPEMIGNGKKAKSVVQHHVPAFDVSPSERGVLTSSEDIASTWFQPHYSKRASLHSLFLALTVHSFIEGMSIGAQEHMSSFIGISVAVAAHKALAGFALGSNMIAGCRNKAMYVGVTIFASCSPLGMMIGTEAAEVLSATGVGLLLALASGTFLYVALPDLLLPALHSHGCATIYLNTFLGMLGMSVLALWV